MSRTYPPECPLAMSAPCGRAQELRLPSLTPRSDFSTKPSPLYHLNLPEKEYTPNILEDSIQVKPGYRFKPISVHRSA